MNGGPLAAADRLKALARLMEFSSVEPQVLAELDGRITELEHLAGLAQTERLSPRVPEGGERPRFVPPYAIDFLDDEEVRGRCTFGPFYVGSGEESIRIGSVHGGAMALLFDEVLGWISLRGGKIRTRTAYLKIDFRAMATVPAELTFRGWVDRVEGRKQFILGELMHGETMIAQAECLYVTPRGWETDARTT